MTALTRWNPLRVAAWGACIGGIGTSIGLFGQWGTAPFASVFGELLGGVAGGGVIFGVAAVLRNLVVRAK
jgi:hypothetical protein